MFFQRLNKVVALIAALTATMSVLAGVNKLPVKRVNGRLYHYYEVGPRETIYSLCYKLDVTRDEMMRNNPGVAEGLKQGMVLYFPFEDYETSDHSVNNEVSVSHTADVGTSNVSIASTSATSLASSPERDDLYEVKRGETIFGISHKYNITAEELISANPILKDGLKAGQFIVIPGGAVSKTDTKVAEPESNDTTSQPAVTSTEGYIVKKKETFYSIARNHGISVESLAAANPGVGTLREGQVLNIPVSTSSAPVAVTGEPADSIASELGGSEPADLTDNTQSVTEDAPAEVSIAVMLPFMLNEETQSKSAARYTEFYKGFLLAADSLRNCGTPINITAYDTEGSVLKIREALTDTTFRRHNLIIAPDNAAQLAVLAEYGRNNNVKVANLFLVRDDNYLTNQAVMQGNLPSQLMYRKAIDALLERLTVATPVFITLSGEKGDKADFVAELRKSLDAKGKSYMDIEVDGRLSSERLQALPADGNYVFIPESSRQADLNRLMPGIIEWRDQALTPTVRLFGYPEWTTFRGETLINMHNLNTMVFSRFYTDDDAWSTRRVDAAYRKWYGAKMENAVPRQGLMGFDFGMYAIQMLKSGRNDGYDGVQNGFYFTDVTPDSGAFNQTLYFINFRPGSTVDKTRL